MRKDNGFGQLGVILAGITLLIIGGIAWYVYDKNKSNDTVANQTATTSSKSSANTGLKEFKSTQFGFSFKYPSGWILVDKTENGGRGGPEGELHVESPNGLKLRFDPNFGGKGGSCTEDPSDKPHDTKNCSTKEALKIEKIGVTVKPFDEDIDVYLIKYKFTDSRGEDGVIPESEYNMSLEADHGLEVGKPIIGAYFPLGIINLGNYYVNTTIVGVDKSSANFFEQPEVKQAEEVLKSFKVL